MDGASYDFPIDLSWSENPTYTVPSATVSPELPPADYSTQSNVAVSTGAANSGWTFTGLLDGAKSTAQTLLGAWGTYQGLQTQSDQINLQRAIAAGQIQIAHDGLNADVAKANAASEVEKARAAAAVSVAQNQANASKNGSVYIPAATTLSLPVLLGVAAIGFAVMSARRKGAK